MNAKPARRDSGERAGAAGEKLWRLLLYAAAGNECQARPRDSDLRAGAAGEYRG
jgi:hypothetical protein